MNMLSDGALIRAARKVYEEIRKRRVGALHWDELAPEAKQAWIDAVSLSFREYLPIVAEKLQAAGEALQPLVDIADAYDENGLDDEARKWYGRDDNRIYKNYAPEAIELYAGRGGKQLLTLAQCLQARKVVRGE